MGRNKSASVSMGCGASGPVKKTSKQIAEMSGRMWKQMDADRSGSLTKAELQAYFDNDQEVIDRLIKEVEVDGDGVITDKEWKSYWQKQIQKSAAENQDVDAWITRIETEITERKQRGRVAKEKKDEAKKEWKKKLALGKGLGLDANQDGSITKDELRNYLKQQNGGECSDELLEETYKTLDRDADGNLTVADVTGGSEQ